ncbi:GntR family transcriptional regulator [Actinomadura sp. KC216]|uniref:FadR/GntR family transcriptional regulator n=1 Tax=Actinomadura sp. KC216 TaxID=2530370 RepID=UPI00244290B6|nr:GntR family transcriptional regulator [Actinomadura sp. KC216]
MAQMRALIREGKLVPGDRLPSERSLCQRFGVSRVTVREALRVLEAGGLVDIRVGARGGAFVTKPSSERVGEGLAELMTLAPMTGGDVTEARLIFELGILPLVVERATEEDIAELPSLVERGLDALEDGTYTMATSAEFHVRVASSTHNPAIEMHRAARPRTGPRHHDPPPAAHRRPASGERRRRGRRSGRAGEARLARRLTR